MNSLRASIFSYLIRVHKILSKGNWNTLCNDNVQHKISLPFSPAFSQETKIDRSQVIFFCSMWSKFTRNQRRVNTVHLNSTQRKIHLTNDTRSGSYSRILSSGTADPSTSRIAQLERPSGKREDSRIRSLIRNTIGRFKLSLINLPTIQRFSLTILHIRVTLSTYVSLVTRNFLKIQRASAWRE